MENTSSKAPLLLGLLGSIIGLALIVWMYTLARPEAPPAWVLKLPILNAGLNFLSAIALIRGWLNIKAGKRTQHMRWMIIALITSGLFLISYLTYHHFKGDTKFMAEGIIRPIYFFILISHILLSFINLPMILITLGYALRSNFTKHKGIARWTLPIWLYVSVTGVLIFLILQLFQPHA